MDGAVRAGREARAPRGVGGIVALALAAVPALIFALGALPLLEAGADPMAMRLPESAAPVTWCCEDVRIIVNLRRNSVGDTGIFVRGREVTPRVLTQKLLVFAERKRDMEHPDQPSEVWARIRAEPDLPWGDIRAVLDACRDPDVRIYKIQFATQPIRR